MSADDDKATPHDGCVDGADVEDGSRLRESDNLTLAVGESPLTVMRLLCCL